MQGVPYAVGVVVVLPVLVLAQSRTVEVTEHSRSSLTVERLASLEFPWGMDWLPDGRLLVTEKPGRLRIFADGALSEPIANVPSVAYRGDGDQGGLLDVAVDPDFATTRYLYLSYSEAAAEPAPAPDPGDPRFGPHLGGDDRRIMGGAVARAKLDGDALTGVEVIWRQVPKTVGRGHFGHRLLFGRDGTLFITSGERMRFDPAQRRDSNLGKVVRIHRDGTIPKDNPIPASAEARGDIWSLGHRNMLAAAIAPESDELWVVEMGPLGGDELNCVQRGANYGWPEVSNGVNYDRSPIPDHDTRPAFAAPIRTWTPVISPSGALFYTGTLFPWRGSLVIGGLSSKALVRLTMNGAEVRSEDRIDMGQRIRDVIQARDGALLVLTDEKDGELMRLTPTSATRR